MAETNPVHIQNLTIQHYPKTQEGQAILGSMQVFCLQGKLWQGIRGGGYTETNERVLTDEEFDSLYDVDGSKDVVAGIRAGRAASRAYRKSEELQRREEVKQDRRLKDLQMAQMERDLGVGKYADQKTAPTIAAVPDLPPAPVAPVAAVETTATTLPSVACGTCGKESPLGKKNPAAWLRMHTMGAHTDKPRRGKGKNIKK